MTLTHLSVDARAASYVTRSMLSPGEILRQLRATLLTPALAALTVLTGLLLIAPPALDGSLRFLLAIALVANFGRMVLLLSGKVNAIAAYGTDGTLMGAIRFRQLWFRQRWLIAGIHVDPASRGQGVAELLLLACLHLAREQAPVRVLFLVPSHPAVKRLVQKHLAGGERLISKSAALPPLSPPFKHLALAR